MIKVEGLRKSFFGKELFHDINLDINEGDVIGIIGPSGTGKSIFLRCLMMLEHPSGGRIFLDGQDITAGGADLNEVHKKIGMVFQNFNLFEHMSVIENVMSGQVHLQGMDPHQSYDESMMLLKTVGLMDKAFAYPGTLSNGQKQRVAIARTMAMSPEIVLMDEPTSSLDPMMRGEVETVIRMMAAAGHTIVIVTHEMELVEQICNRVLFFNEGIIYEEGSPKEIFENPKRDATRRFVRALRVLEFDIQSNSFDFPGMQTAIEEFAYRNGVRRDLLDRLYAVNEELCQMIIIQPKDERKMHITVEYNHKERSLNGRVLFSGPKFDADDPLYVFSWPIIERRAASVDVEDYNENGYTNKISFVIK